MKCVNDQIYFHVILCEQKIRSLCVFFLVKAGAQISLADEEYSEDLCTKCYNLLNYMYMPDMDGKVQEVPTQQELVKYTYTIHMGTFNRRNYFYNVMYKLYIVSPTHHHIIITSLNKYYLV